MLLISRLSKKRYHVQAVINVMAPQTLKYNHKHTCPAKDKAAIVNNQAEQLVQDLVRVLTDAVC